MRCSRSVPLNSVCASVPLTPASWFAPPGTGVGFARAFAASAPSTKAKSIEQSVARRAIIGILRPLVIRDFERWASVRRLAALVDERAQVFVAVLEHEPVIRLAAQPRRDDRRHVGSDLRPGVGRRDAVPERSLEPAGVLPPELRSGADVGGA